MINIKAMLMLALAAATCPSFVHADTCHRGIREGQDEVKKMWKSRGEDCSEIFLFENMANRSARRRFAGRTSNWKTRRFNGCALEGAKNMVERIEKKCLEDSTTVCDDLAEEAAEVVVFQNVCNPALDYELPVEFDARSYNFAIEFGMTVDTQETADALETAGTPDYQDECRESAVDSCPGLIILAVGEYCQGSDRNVTLSDLQILQSKCEDAVDQLLLY